MKYIENYGCIAYMKIGDKNRFGAKTECEKRQSHLLNLDPDKAMPSFIKGSKNHIFISHFPKWIN